MGKKKGGKGGQQAQGGGGGDQPKPGTSQQQAQPPPAQQPRQEGPGGDAQAKPPQQQQPQGSAQQQQGGDQGPQQQRPRKQKQQKQQQQPAQQQQHQEQQQQQPRPPQQQQPQQQQQGPPLQQQPWQQQQQRLQQQGGQRGPQQQQQQPAQQQQHQQQQQQQPRPPQQQQPQQQQQWPPQQQQPWQQQQQRLQQQGDQRGPQQQQQQPAQQQQHQQQQQQQPRPPQQQQPQQQQQWPPQQQQPWQQQQQRLQQQGYQRGPQQQLPPGFAPPQQQQQQQGWRGPPQQQQPPGQQQQHQQRGGRGQPQPGYAGQPQAPGGRGRPLSQPQSPHEGSPAPQQVQVEGPRGVQQQQGPPQQARVQSPPQQQQQEQTRVQSPPQQTRVQSPPQQVAKPQPGAPPQAAAARQPQSPLRGQGNRLHNTDQVTPGTKGRKIMVESNHLSLNVGNKISQAYHYDVDINPDTPKNMLRDVINTLGRKHFPNNHPAFDGRKNLYSPVLLPFGDTISDAITLNREGRDREFKVTVKMARTVDLTPLRNMLRSRASPMDALQVLDIVLRNAPSNAMITAGRCFFSPPEPGRIIPLGDGMEMYYGFYQSAIRGWKQPLLNVDVAHKAFPKADHMLDVVCELGSDFRNTMKRDQLSRPINDYLRATVDKFVKMLKVEYEIPGQPGSRRVQRANGLGEPAATAKFKLEDGRTITVNDYFKTVKRTTLQYPHLPTVWVGAKDRRVLVPLEFCTIKEGQPVNRKMTETQTSNMIKKAATSTDVRKGNIMRSVQRANFNNDPCIREFGFSVGSDFQKLDARVLEPPSLLYANNSVIRPAKGVWRADRASFLEGATIQRWAVAGATRYPSREVGQFIEMVATQGRQSGMNIEQRPASPYHHIEGRNPQSDILKYFQNNTAGLDLVFVVVPNAGPQYSYVKKAAELNVGCLTQCIKERTLQRINPQTVGNILLKVNSKMNGRNHTFAPVSRPLALARPCMIMGADVTHPSPDAQHIPSVAAVTASHDPKAFQYNICWRLQPPRMEIIEDLCAITVEQLNFFYKKTKCKPEKIFFFRDGVSEGQFEQVQRAEITAIKQACKQVQEEDYEPQITFLVVQKRHHTRLFPCNPRDSEDRNNNVPAGTIVDSQITNPTMQDFYLVSHASIQGVAKPTKYCTLWDDNDMTHDAMEQMAYYLCHMFTRCNRSVSYPAPTYYAHLAAARAKVYIENERLDVNNLEALKNYHIRNKIKDDICKGKPMFFV